MHRADPPVLAHVVEYPALGGAAAAQEIIAMLDEDKALLSSLPLQVLAHEPLPDFLFRYLQDVLPGMRPDELAALDAQADPAVLLLGDVQPHGVDAQLRDVQGGDFRVDEEELVLVVAQHRQARREIRIPLLVDLFQDILLFL